MTRAEAKIIDQEIMDVLAKHGYKGTCRCRYGDVTAKFTVEVESQTHEAQKRISNRENTMIGLYLAGEGIHNVGNEKFIGREVKAIDGNTYIIKGYNSKAKKYPIELQNRAGTKGFKASAKQIIWK